MSRDLDEGYVQLLFNETVCSAFPYGHLFFCVL